MFNIFKSKPKVKPARPLFEALGTDMHCHLIPGVDDGSKSEDETVTCLHVMKEAGFNKVFFTPHYQSPRFPNVEEDILNKFEDTKKRIDMLGPYDGPELVGVAGEYRIDSGFSKRIDDNKFLKIANKFVLTELSLHQQVMGLDEVMFNLQMKDNKIILAHPERYPYYSSSSRVLEHFKEMDISFQVNILSLCGFYGEASRAKGFELIEKGWVEYLGTDMHNTLYAQALIDCTYDKKIRKVIEKYEFQNKNLTNSNFTNVRI